MRSFSIFIGFLTISLLSWAQEPHNHKSEDNPHWSYDEQSGPSHWSELSKSYVLCGMGKRQSPIDIVTDSVVVKKEDISFDYFPYQVTLANNGHTLIEKIPEDNALHLMGKDYSLVQFHFHTPSEHHIDGKAFPLEVHFVHKTATGRHAVVAVLIEEGKNSCRFLSKFTGEQLPTKVGQKVSSDKMVSPIDALPKKRSFYYYEGSLTTPPCTEGVQWILMTNHIVATAEQIALIHDVIKDDNRPVQNKVNRTVYLSKQ